MPFRLLSADPTNPFADPTDPFADTRDQPRQGPHIAVDPSGALAAPVRDGLGQHVATATPHAPDHDREHDDQLRAAHHRAFAARWLDGPRAKNIRLVPGLEHPGVPRQPDNHHKH